jgi:S-adenosylmethionine-diacylgycerolhomoserine-N-methlytransferase
LSATGRIHIVDFGDLSGLGGAGRAILLAWLRLFHVTPRVELLHTFEQDASTSLRLLPGRYAFLLTSQKGGILLNPTFCCRAVTDPG